MQIVFSWQLSQPERTRQIFPCKNTLESKRFIVIKKTVMGLLHPNFRTDYDHYCGSPLAPIELMQYGDFQCEYCAETYPVIKFLQDAFGDLLKFVYRHYPVPTRHPLSLQAAVATEAAAIQGKVLAYARYDI